MEENETTDLWMDIAEEEVGQINTFILTDLLEYDYYMYKKIRGIR